MLPLDTKAGCCISNEPLPLDINCLAPDICQELDYLLRRHRRAFIKNNRIMEMAKAKPRARSHRFSNQCPCLFKKNIEIIHLEQRKNTRTEQLAYPRARQLLVFKEQIRNIFLPDRILNINRLIRKSLFSLYSRLGNVQPPIAMKPRVKWTKEDWVKHNKILKKLSKPKKLKMPPRRPSKKLPLSKIKRYKNLAKPKKCHRIEKAEWTLTQEIRRHKASERTIKLAKPIIRDTFLLHQELPIEIALGVLKHKASKRTMELAKPNMQKAQSDLSDLKRENPFAVSPNALKTKASKRIEELAEPKEYENNHIREDPYAISKAALKAKAKPRTIKLAQARQKSI